MFASEEGKSTKTYFFGTIAFMGATLTFRIGVQKEPSLHYNRDTRFVPAAQKTLTHSSTQSR